MIIEQLDDGRIRYIPRMQSEPVLGWQVGQFAARVEPDNRGATWRCCSCRAPIGVQPYVVDIVIDDVLPEHDVVGVCPTVQAAQVFADCAWQLGAPQFADWLCVQYHAAGDWEPFHIWRRQPLVTSDEHPIVSFGVDRAD